MNSKWKEHVRIGDVDRQAIEWVILLTNKYGLTHQGVANVLQANGFEAATYQRCRNRKDRWLNMIDPTPLPESFTIDADYWNTLNEAQGEPEVAGSSFLLESNEALTAEQLMQHFGMNPEEWEVVSFEVKMREHHLRQERKDLEANMGRWDGTVSTDPVTKPLFSYSLRVKPKENPKLAIHAVALTVVNPRSKVDQGDDKDLKHMLLLADLQIGLSDEEPYHSRDVLAIALELTRRYYFSHIIFPGDLLDLEQFSNFDGDRSMRNVQRSIYEAAYWMGMFAQENAQATIKVLEGNHDMRLRKSVAKVLPGASGLCSAQRPGDPVLALNSLIGLDGMGIEYHPGWPGNDTWFGRYLCIKHGESYSSTPGGTVAAMLRRASENTIAGHSHHSEMASKNLETSTGARTVTCVSLPCGCRNDGIVPGKSAHPDWHVGFGVVTFSTTRRLFQYEPVLVNFQQAVFRGQTVKSNADEHVTNMLTLYGEAW